jgi:hypothetical protein
LEPSTLSSIAIFCCRVSGVSPLDGVGIETQGFPGEALARDFRIVAGLQHHQVRANDFNRGVAGQHPVTRPPDFSHAACTDEG